MAKQDVIVPDLGGATEVDVIEVLVKPGDKVDVDDSLITLESDKATMDLPSSHAGVVSAIKVAVGDKVSEGTLVLTLDAEEVQGKAEEAPAAETQTAAAEAAEPAEPAAPASAAEPTPPRPPEVAAEVPPPARAETKVAGGPSVAEAPSSTGGQAYASPSVRRFARKLGVDLNSVPGSGRNQRILAEDVEAYVKNRMQRRESGLPGSTEREEIDFSRFGEIELQSLSKIKRLSGENLHRSWLSIPHVTQFDEADIGELEAFRKRLNQDYKGEGVKFTYLPFLLKAVVSALKSYPYFNASLETGGERLVLKHYYHIGVAVDTPDGLVVPVIRDVDKKGLLELARELMAVSERARKRQLKPGEMQGGTFTITSLGGIGGTAFTPIVNAPEVAILGLSRTLMKPVFEDGSFVPRLMLPLSLSYDHRVVDGAAAARFTAHLAQSLGDMRRLLL